MNLDKINFNKVDLDPRKIAMFMVVKNESLRLPYFIDYHRILGVNQFFIIDNNSSDKTIELLCEHEDTYVFSTADNYKEHWSWISQLLLDYGLGRWCLVMDADELLSYPNCDVIKLNDLCKILNQKKSRSLHCILLDMYSNIPISEVNYKPGQNPLEVASWFDPNSHHKIRSRYYGGMRERVFGITPCLTKYPLFYFDRDLHISRGTHEISEKPTEDIRGSLLHFKYMQDFYEKVIDGSKNEQYWNDSIEYKAYAKILEIYPHLNLWCQDSSKLSNKKKLLDLDIERFT